MRVGVSADSGRWSRGMILASGARGRGFDSRTAPLFFSFPKGDRYLRVAFVCDSRFGDDGNL